MQRHITILPILATIIGIGFFSAMDAAMKSASIAVGAYSAYFLRCVIGVSIISPVWLLQRHKWPSREVLKIHLTRGLVVAFMGWSFFFSLVRLPLAEAIALSFIAPLIALYLAAIILAERVRPRAVYAALLGLAGVLAIIGGKIGNEEMSDEAALGTAALLLSAVLYAWNLILQRQQALVASPVEVSTFQNGIVAIVLLAGTPFLLVILQGDQWIDIAAGAVLGVAAALILSWAYARAETQILVPIEYTGFLWAVLFGWLFFQEEVTIETLAGTSLIVIGCLIAARKRPEQSAL
ncbi:MAG TPA: EamA family transporter [Erythrobacter sp.]|nr:EamA family transporter [Erythrobacter sp.]